MVAGSPAGSSAACQLLEYNGFCLDSFANN